MVKGSSWAACVRWRPSIPGHPPAQRFGQPLAGRPPTPAYRPLVHEHLLEPYQLERARLRGHLAGQQDTTVVIAERDGDLPCMLVDSQIEHAGGSVRHEVAP